MEVWWWRVLGRLIDVSACRRFLRTTGIFQFDFGVCFGKFEGVVNCGCLQGVGYYVCV